MLSLTPFTTFLALYGYTLDDLRSKAKPGQLAAIRQLIVGQIASHGVKVAVIARLLDRHPSSVKQSIEQHKSDLKYFADYQRLHAAFVAHYAVVTGEF